MLYNQALLLMLYTEAYQATTHDFYARTAREIVTYVLRDMTAPEGGFYSAEDADSEGEEGIFYLWTVAEIRQVLAAEDAELFLQVFNITPEGNFREGKARQHNIPYRTAEAFGALAARLQLPEAVLRQRLDDSRQRLFAVRERRQHPLKDDKILTDWNGLMIAAMARAGLVFQEERYIKGAARAAEFLLKNNIDRSHNLMRRWIAGEPKHNGFIDDYAFLVDGLLEVYQATFESKWL